MKAIFLFTLSILHFQNSVEAQTPTANEVMKPIYTKAAKENKNVLLIFHASWCGWCKKMDTSLADSSIKASIENNYEIAHLTVYESPGKTNLENAGALKMLTEMGGSDKGLPYWFILDAAGNKLANAEHKPGENTGCPANEAEVNYFIGVLQKTSTLSQPELEKIRKRFRKNEM